MTETPEPATATALPDGFEWAIVEIFGHRRHYGRAVEEERFGAKMLRVDVPTEGDPEKGWVSHYYGGSAIFSYTLTDEATVLRANAPWTPPRPAIAPPPDDDFDDPDPDQAELRW